MEQELGWIKAHRKITKNYVYQHDPTAWRIFFHLLLTVDRKTGIRILGRNQLATELKGLKPTTIYQALKRLNDEHQMVDIKSDNKKSTISICKWEDYQVSIDNAVDNKMTTNRQQNDTILYKQEERSKKKEYIQPLPHSGDAGLDIIKKSSFNYLTEAVCQDIANQYDIELSQVKECREDLRIYCASKGKVYKDYYATLQGWVRRSMEQGKIKHLIKPWEPPVKEGELVISTEERNQRAAEIRTRLLLNHSL